MRFSFWICLACAVVLSGSRACICDEVLTGLIVDAASGDKLEGVDVHLYQLFSGKEEPSHLQSAVTDKDGVYTLQVKGNVRPMRLTCLKFSAAGGQHLYGPVNVEPLNSAANGLREGVVNLALTSSAGESLSSAQSRIRSISDHLALQSRKNGKKIIVPSVLEDYVAGVVAKLRNQPDVQFGGELASLVDAIRNDESQANLATVGLTENIVWKARHGANSEGVLLTWKLPGDMTDPMVLSGFGKKTFLNVQTDNWQPVKYSITPHSDGLSVLATKSFDGHEKTWMTYVLLNLDESHVANSQTIWGDVTSTAAQNKQPFTARGSSNGSITIYGENMKELSVLPTVGATPVVATAFSNDGAMIGGVCVDGSYKVWSVQSGVLSNRQPLYEGRLPEPFPASMAFSPDGKSLVFGTGLKSRHAGITVLELTTNGPRFKTTPTTDPITQIQFLTDSGAFISRNARGKASVWNMKREKDDLVAYKSFGLSGIENVNVHPSGKAAIQVEGKEAPIVCSAADILQFDKLLDNSEALKKFGLSVDRPQ